jgi:hypothetical protein
MDQQTAKTVADQIVTALTDDMLDRSGLQQALEDCDADVRDEISSTWMKLIQDILHRNIF